jgi:hypothetical protein
MLLNLSQGQLNLLTLCPRKFQHLVLDQLGCPVPSEQQARMEWGNRFHLLMQQRELGLPIASPPSQFLELALDNVLTPQPFQAYIEALVEAAPDVFQAPAGGVRQSEHRRTLAFQGYLLTAIYDLLILNEQQAQILDWKTYPRPDSPRHLEQNWQTRLYSFLLAETSDYAPEQISMTYWFVQGRSHQAPQPQSLRFVYSEAQHRQTRQDLSRLLDQLSQGLAAYEQGQNFPQVEHSQGACGGCTFALRCQRERSHLESPLLHLEQIAEVHL